LNKSQEFNSNRNEKSKNLDSKEIEIFNIDEVVNDSTDGRSLKECRSFHSPTPPFLDCDKLEVKNEEFETRTQAKDISMINIKLKNGRSF
jgi:hypothetical protein